MHARTRVPTMKRCFRCVLFATFTSAGHTLVTPRLSSHFGNGNLHNPWWAPGIPMLLGSSGANLPFSMFCTDYFTPPKGYRPLACLRIEDSHDPSQSHFLRCSSRLFNSDVRDFAPRDNQQAEAPAHGDYGFDSSKLPSERPGLRTELTRNCHGWTASRWSAL